MSRIGSKFRELRNKGKKAFIAFITAGDPDLTTTKDLVLELEKKGVDIVELGVPFSDPLADGVTIQKASERALKHKTSLKEILRTVKELRKETEIPIALMTYYNPIYKHGPKRFVANAVDSGVDGVIVPDLPPEEARELKAEAKLQGLDTVFLLAPTSTPQRMELVARVSEGFIYYVSLTGVTGMRERLPKLVRERIRELKKYTDKPVAIGFGVSTPIQAREVASWADGVIVGSAIVKVIEENLTDPQLVKKVGDFVSGFSQAIKEI